MRSDKLDSEAGPVVQIEHAPDDVKALALRAFKAGAFPTYSAPGRYVLVFEDVCVHGTYNPRSKCFSMNGFTIDATKFQETAP